MKPNRITRNISTIKQLQDMTEEQIDVFMVGFLDGLEHWNFSMNNLATFMQLLLQMDSKLAERFMKEMADRDEKKDDE